VEHRFQGQTDIELDETGKAQAERAAKLLAVLRPDLIVSSDLSRAATTAAALARLTGLPVSYDKDLRERHGGSWEGLTDPEIRARYPLEHANWEPPDGEPVAVVAERVGGALQRVAAQLAEGDVIPAGRDAVSPGKDVLPAGKDALPVGRDYRLAVVVSHGGAIRFGLARLLGLPEDLYRVLGPLSNCSWSVVGTRRGQWRILEHNAGTLPGAVLGDDR
jgi:broad specificity phosphatase PhoE